MCMIRRDSGRRDERLSQEATLIFGIYLKRTIAAEWDGLSDDGESGTYVGNLR